MIESAGRGLALKKSDKFLLPLSYKTPDHWMFEPLKNIPALLSDHAYLERKAASNALELLNRWPEQRYPKEWAKRISSVGRDEASHLHAVIEMLAKRGWPLQRLHKSQYASDLRGLARKGQAFELADRLLISALIEARSCERFEILSRQSIDIDLARFYKSLVHSEWGHHHVFLDLAKEVVSETEVNKRWNEMVSQEAEIIQEQPIGPWLLSGIPADTKES